MSMGAIIPVITFFPSEIKKHNCAKTKISNYSQKRHQAQHIKNAASQMGQYCIALFPKDKGSGDSAPFSCSIFSAKFLCLA